MPAHSTTLWRRNFGQAQRQCTHRRLPLRSVTGATPRYCCRLAASGQRSRLLPKTASRRGAKVGPAPGRLAKHYGDTLPFTLFFFFSCRGSASARLFAALPPWAVHWRQSRRTRCRGRASAPVQPDARKPHTRFFAGAPGDRSPCGGGMLRRRSHVVPVISCPHCGESYMTSETMHEIERIKLHRKSLSRPQPVAVAHFG
jgi:hypothetical protein